MAQQKKVVCPDGDELLAKELDYLYKRLATVNDLIRSLEEYDLHRTPPEEAQEKPA